MNSADIRPARHSGIDFLRILSMFLIVIHHLLFHGGLLKATAPMSAQYETAWFLNIMAYCAVDCFALVSGYVGYKAKYKWSRLINIWLGVLFYSVVITVIFAIAKPDSVSSSTWLPVLFPINYDQYWYLTSYVGMFLFIPFLNIAIEKTDKKYIPGFLLASFILISVLSCVFQRAPYGIDRGFSTIWLCMMYLVGGFIHKYDFAKRISRKKSVLLFLFASLLTWGVKIAIESIWENSAYGNIFYSYISPTIIANSIALLCFFANTNFKTRFANKSVSVFAPAALGVYLIHEHPFIRRYFIFGITERFAKSNPVVIVLAILGYAIAIYAICSVIELARLELFRLLRINQLCRKITNSKLLCKFFGEE